MIKILLVDDHLIVRNGVKLMLGTDPDICVVAEAENARDALRLVDMQEFDVAIIDIALPDRTGLDLVKSIKARKPKLAVLVLSMYAEDVYAVRAIKIGAAGYLTKNSPAGTLVAAVHKAAAGGKHMTSELAEKLAGMLAGDSMPLHDTLSDRELEVMKLVATGTSVAKVAETLHLSPNTVTTYRARVMEKMGFASNMELVRYVIENGLAS